VLASTPPTVHIVGLGLAGLSAAVRLAQAGRRIALYEAAGHAGGRCRSFHDASLGTEIDNGNHLLLSGNDRALAYLDVLGARDELKEFRAPSFPFVDLRSGERWCLRLGEGAAPWWIFDSSRRVRGASLGAHLSAAKILFAGRSQTVAQVVGTAGLMHERFWDPLCIAVLNTRPGRGSAQLLRHVLAETFVRGGRRARPMIARRSLGRAFVEPALRRLAGAGVCPRFREPLRALQTGEGGIRSLRFAAQQVDLGRDDAVILAVSASRLKALLPDIDVPQDNAVIANAHFRVAEEGADDDAGEAIDFVGLVNARTHWIFRRPGLISTTISAAHELGIERQDGEELLDAVWSEVRRALHLAPDAVPLARRLIREKRATFDQSPAGVRLRPRTATRHANLFLAGDFVDTRLPATIEGAIRSGEAAAHHCLARREASRTILQEV